ncbi:hypothetical protein JRI60_23635 [Archangium violaceum]|uniref:hypothetical protein n=1 Tax=Archangium violaceum TaxID=83451 RepID=UPI00194ED592|nr:hypothetical protein [Archangium violaceum]QRO01800.1 hypothetical protein JRI60_23635 [Archangium violaceum]
MQYALDPRLLPPGGVPVQCTRCSHVFIAAPPEQATPQTTQVFGSPVPQAAPRPAAPQPNPNLGSTLLYGGNKGAQQPSAQTTQVFGAVPQVPPVAPVANKPPPVANKPQQAGGPPVPTGTQVFGAVPQPTGAQPQSYRPPSASGTPPFGSAVPQIAPVARPQAGAAPATSTTQVFGAVPQQGQAPVGTPPTTSTTQAFGGVPVPGPQPGSARGPQPVPGMAPGSEMTQPFGGRPGQTAAGPTSQPPGLVPRAATQESSVPVKPAPAPVVGVSASTTIELPDEVPIPRTPMRPIAELLEEETGMSLEEIEEPSPSRGPSPTVSQPLELPPELSSLQGASGSTLSKPLELPPALLDEAVESIEAGDRRKRPKSGRGGRGLLIAAGVLVLALTAFLTSPAWRSKSKAVPHAALVARDEAVAMLRRDDMASHQEAFSRLRSLAGAHPDSIELLAEEGVALATYMDDTRVLVATLQAKMARLQEQISTLSEAQTPADWQSRVNTMRDELAATQRELTPIEERGTQLAKDAAQVLKRLSGAPEKDKEEEKEVALLRLRARAMLSGAMSVNETLNLAVQLAQAGQQDWSTLALAVYVLNNPTASPNQVSETITALERMRESDKTFLRAYVLGARIALMRQQPAAALPLLDTVITLNPKHELAQKLHAYAQALVDKEHEPAPPTPAPTPAPESASTTPEAAPTTPEAAPTTPEAEASPTP